MIEMDILSKAIAFAEQYRPQAALDCLLGLLHREPDNARAWFCLGLIEMQQLGLFREAIDHFNHALKLDPSFEDPIFWRGHAHLTLGDYEQGFEDFEYRSKEVVNSSGIEWTGQDLTGKTLLVVGVHEAGHGDLIQFSRYLPMLAETGARVVAFTLKHVRPLLNNVRGIEFLNRGGKDHALPACDFWIRHMSLAKVFRTRINTVPPPLTGLGELREHETFNVGIFWHTSTSVNSPHRSIPFTELAPLLLLSRSHKQLRFIGMQKELPDRDKTLYSDCIEHIGELFEDFGDTARAIMACDLVITIDTSVAHLAGTLGIPTWVLVDKIRPYWVWALGNSTPWYPNVTMYHQNLPGNWKSVVKDVVTDFEKLLQRYEC